jgi:sporulation protein YlmC with PRC-barrel domain
MKLKYGVDILSWENEKVGKLEHIVVDPATNEITHLVAKKGMLIPNDKVIPISLVLEANEDRIKLFAFEGDFDDFEDYIDVNYVRAEKKRAEELTNEEGEEIVPLLAYPPAGMLGFGYMPVIQYPDEEQAELLTNIPEGTVDLSTGAEVVGMDGERVGDVKELIYESSTVEITHLVISEGILFSEEKLIPVSWVTDYDRNQVQLVVASDLVEQLPEYKG